MVCPTLALCTVCMHLRTKEEEMDLLTSERFDFSVSSNRGTSVPLFTIVLTQEWSAHLGCPTEQLRWPDILQLLLCSALSESSKPSLPSSARLSRQLPDVQTKKRHSPGQLENLKHSLKTLC